jgi:hypothetical protein
MSRHESEDAPKIKAVRQGYSPAPFYLVQQSDQGETRFVAWTSELRQLKQLIDRLLDTFPDQVEVLLKVDTGETADQDSIWNRYVGRASRKAVREALVNYERYVFQDGDNQLCVKRPDTDEYFALDHCGVLYVYSSSPQLADLCAGAGFARQHTAELISDAGHWRVSLKDGEQLREGLIHQLGLALDVSCGPSE